jgi:hypothetical protein
MKRVGEMLSNLKDDDPKVRAQAALLLRDAFSEEVGEHLIRALFAERRSQAFVLICHAVIPKWIVKLELRLSERGDWPFDSMRTLWLARGTRAWRLPSMEARVEAMLQTNDWALRLAAIEYCDAHQLFVLKAREVCRDLLEEQFDDTPQLQVMANAFSLPDPESLRAHIRELIHRFRPFEPES